MSMLLVCTLLNLITIYCYLKTELFFAILIIAPLILFVTVPYATHIKDKLILIQYISLLISLYLVYNSPLIIIWLLILYWCQFNVKLDNAEFVMCVGLVIVTKSFIIFQISVSNSISVEDKITFIDGLISLFIQNIIRKYLPNYILYILGYLTTLAYCELYKYYDSPDSLLPKNIFIFVFMMLRAIIPLTHIYDKYIANKISMLTYISLTIITGFILVTGNIIIGTY